MIAGTGNVFRNLRLHLTPQMFLFNSENYIPGHICADSLPRAGTV